MRKSMRIGSALAIAAVLAVGGIQVGQSYAAVGINSDEPTTMSFSLNQTVVDTAMAGSVIDTENPDIAMEDVPMAIYQIATVDIGGKYTATDDFTNLNLSVIDSDTTAEEWATLSTEALKFVTEDTENLAGIAEDNLGQGLFLVVPGTYNEENDDYEVETIEHVYTFTPFIAALPYNYYYNGGNDDWVYNMDYELKMGVKDRTIPLTLTKILFEYDEFYGPAVFAFEITATKGSGQNAYSYSNVVGLTFTESGEQTITIDDIPYGAKVTISEIYDGAYRSADGDVTIDCLQDSYQYINDDEEITITGNNEPEMVNVKDDFIPHGGGKVNHYTYNAETDSYEVTQQNTTGGTTYSGSDIENASENDETVGQYQEAAK